METKEVAEVAKKVYIAYTQLTDLLSELRRLLERGARDNYKYHWQGAPSYARGFNAILKSVKEAFEIDEEFSKSIEDLEKVEERIGPGVLEDVLSRGSKLKGAVKAFVSFYMSGEERTKIGFSPDTER